MLPPVWQGSWGLLVIYFFSYLFKLAILLCYLLLDFLAKTLLKRSSVASLSNLTPVQKTWSEESEVMTLWKCGFCGVKRVLQLAFNKKKIEPIADIWARELFPNTYTGCVPLPVLWFPWEWNARQWMGKESRHTQMVYSDSSCSDDRQGTIHPLSYADKQLWLLWGVCDCFTLVEGLWLLRR